MSYVWGSVESAQTTSTNLGRLMLPGSLDKVSEDFRIPATIKDAMRLVALLGKRYLWVDRLCIVQDGSTKQMYLDSMAAIYATASLTIAATAGKDADHGLRGVPGASFPRCFPHPVLDFEYDNWRLHVLLVNSRKESILSTPWTSRGWTMQEEAFSRRTLFIGDIVLWNCPSAS